MIMDQLDLAIEAQELRVAELERQSRKENFFMTATKDRLVICQAQGKLEGLREARNIVWDAMQEL